MPKPLGSDESDDNTQNDNSQDGAATGTENEDQKGDDNSEKKFSQEDMDKAIKDRLNRENEKHQKELEAASKKAADEAIAEYERKQKMSDKEKEDEERRLKDEELERTKRELNITKNRASAQQTMQEKGLPLSLVDWVVRDTETETNEQIEKFGKAFNDAVQKGVEAKLAEGHHSAPQDSGHEGDKTSGDGKKSIHDLLYKKG